MTTKAEGGGRERERSEDATLLALRVEEGAMAKKDGKGKEMGWP